MLVVPANTPTKWESTLTRCRWSAKFAIGAFFVGALLSSAGCGKREDKLIPFDGFYYKAKAAPVDKKASRADFTATVWEVSQSLEGARQAGHHEATKYCIKEYGSSKVTWSVGPDTPPEQLRIVDDTLTFAGKCDP